MIVGHPGTGINEAIDLAVYLRRNNIQLKQIQEFTPTPLTISTLMYVTGKDLAGKSIIVPRGRDIRLQKALVQWFIPGNKKLVIEALRKAQKSRLIQLFYPQ